MRRFLFLFLFLIFGFALSESAEKQSRAQSLYEQAAQLSEDSQYTEAIDKFLVCLDLSEKEKNPHLHAKCYIKIGMVYVRFGDFERAISYFNKAAKEGDDIPDYDIKTESMARIASVYALSNDTRKAKEYYDKQLKSGGTGAEAQYFKYYNLSLIKCLENDFDSAFEAAFKALHVAQTLKMPERYANSIYGFLGVLHSKSGNEKKALIYFEKFKKDTENYPNGLYAMETYCTMLADHYTFQGNTELGAYFRHQQDSIAQLRVSADKLKKVNNSVFSFEEAKNSQAISNLSAKLHRYLGVVITFSILLIALTIAVWSAVRKQKKLNEAYVCLSDRHRELTDREAQLRQMLQSQYGEEKEKAPESEISSREALLSEQQAGKLLNKILKVMANVDIISASDFNLGKLAELCDSNTRYVSWVINEVYKKTFKGLLNQYRITEVCRRIDDRENYGHLTISAISRDLGYNSQSNFIASFKSVTGMLPSTYQKASASTHPVSESDSEPSPDHIETQSPSLATE